MAQHLKDQVQQSIVEAALAVIAHKGVAGATMAQIGRAAGVSTGNIYRYYRNKEVLFEALISDAFVARFVSLIRRRIDALEGVEDYRTLGPAAAYNTVSAELLEFCIENRLRVVILLGRCQGTRLEGFARQFADGLVKGAIAHFAGLRPDRKVTRSMRFGLEVIYRNFVDAMVRIFEHFEDPPAIRQAVADYSRYHLVGLKSFFE